MKKVSIIIVTWNGMKWIDKCLSSIRQSCLPVTVFLVDNNSTDGTQSYISKNYSEVKLTLSNKNLGFGKVRRDMVMRILLKLLTLPMLLIISILPINWDLYLLLSCLIFCIYILRNIKYSISFNS